MFGISLSEVALIAVVALLVVGPQKLPSMLRTLGEWARKLRQMTTQVRAQTGIDEILRQEGIDGGISELRSLIRGDLASLTRARSHVPEAEPLDDPYPRAADLDRTREYPPEGPDAGGALADDLWDEPAADAPAATLDAPSHTAPEPAAEAEEPKPE
ncbi:MAG: twin-arginine translocase TatA/TatE family subunit [Myxococcales bacterium]|nr:twin-arginine translocase TatA/TatE family subunit [Myxococcales bacterium]